MFSSLAELLNEIATEVMLRARFSGNRTVRASLFLLRLIDKEKT
jgi:hypothetical protein